MRGWRVGLVDWWEILLIRNQNFRVQPHAMVEAFRHRSGPLKQVSTLHLTLAIISLNDPSKIRSSSQNMQQKVLWETQQKVSNTEFGEWVVKLLLGQIAQQSPKLFPSSDTAQLRLNRRNHAKQALLVKCSTIFSPTRIQVNGKWGTPYCLKM